VCVKEQSYMCVLGSSHTCVCYGAVIHVCVREQS
jgi:hypothetical protein